MMKNLFVSTAVLLLGVSVSWAATVNVADLLDDPTFDGPHEHPSQSIPTDFPGLNGWRQSGWLSCSYQDGDAQSDGSYLRMFNWNSGGQGTVLHMNYTTLTAGNTYELKFWARGVDTPMDLNVHFLLTDWSTVCGEMVFPASGFTSEWQMFTYSYTPTANQDIAVFEMKGYNTGSWGGLEIDSLGVPEPATMGLLVVGGLSVLFRRKR